MKLDEAITHCMEVAEEQDKYCPTPEGVFDEHKACAEEHRQLAEWLRDYKRLLDEPEIVRCKDCKHYEIHTVFNRSQGWCERLSDEFDRSLARGTEKHDFCSHAERKDNG